MGPSEEVCHSLIKWLQTVESKGSRSVAELSDGVAMMRLLVQISPENFSKLEGKVKHDVGSNWRLKVSNLKKIVESILEYYQDVLNLQVLDIGKPDLNKIAEKSDLIQLGKLLRLILGCAVNCEQKQQYITQIMDLEESVQQSIMQAIQQLEEVTGNTGRSGLSFLSLESDTRIIKLMSDLESANEIKDSLAQQCHNLETQVQCLIEEKQTLLSDNQMLSKRIRELETTGTVRSPDNRRQLDLLKEELFKVETVKDDYKAKILEQDKQILLLQEKVGELQLVADTAARLKDEVDALSESADKLHELEVTIASYKKKLEDYGDIKKQLKTLEDKNVEYYQQNLKYEEELKSTGFWKNQCEIYKGQIAELQQKLDEEVQRADKALFQLKNVETKLNALQGEKSRLAQERDALREENEELKMGTGEGSAAGADVARELAPAEMKERLRFLEKENATLRALTQEAAAKKTLLDDAQNRIEKLTEQNRNINQKVLELEEQLQEQRKSSHTDQSPLQSEIVVKEQKQKIASLQEALSVKESDLQTLQAKYNKYVEKAKEVAQNMEHKTNGSLRSIPHGSMKESEEKFLVSAFHKMSMLCHKEAVDERLAMLSAGQGQSFLSRQRAPIPRKPVHSFKSK